jgi:hypothetical protein
MYDTTQVLASIDRNAMPILLMCGLAMLCNYTWFVAAVRQGWRDRTTPIPLFCTLFWLVGDASMVLRYDLWFNVIDHWYVKLFWAALVLTVMCELVFLSLTLRFGHREFAPALSRNQFVALILLGVAATAVAFETVKSWAGDALYINYFHFANLVGPLCGAAMVMRRGSRIGTTPLIWGAYTLMVAAFAIANVLWFGAPFADPRYLLLYGTAICGATLTTWLVIRLPLQPVAQAPGQQPAAA